MRNAMSSPGRCFALPWVRNVKINSLPEEANQRELVDLNLLRGLDNTCIFGPNINWIFVINTVPSRIHVSAGGTYNYLQKKHR